MGQMEVPPWLLAMATVKDAARAINAMPYPQRYKRQLFTAWATLKGITLTADDYRQVTGT